jgi:hypothetical protein
MNPNIFPILNANNAVKAALGNPLRVYPWGRAPKNVKYPYAVYTVYNALPENYLDSRPDIDNKGTQLDIYADNGNDLKTCFDAIRLALEGVAHMTNYSTPVQDADTNLYSCRMEFDFWESA